MGFASIDDQRGKTLAAAIKQINQFKASAHQSAGRNIFRQHRGRQVKYYNDCAVLFEHRLWQLLPGWACQANAANRPGKPEASRQPTGFTRGFSLTLH